MSTVKNAADSTVDNTVEKAERLMETKRAIANAISYKGVPVEENTPFREYADKIRRIRYPDQVIMPLEVTKNGEYKVSLNADGFNPVTVNLPDPPLQEKAATENGEVIPDTNYYGLSKVTVNVPDPPLQEKTVTKNGEVTVDKGYYGLSKVVVNCPRPSIMVVDHLAVRKRGCASYVNANKVYLCSADDLSGPHDNNNVVSYDLTTRITDSSIELYPRRHAKIVKVGKYAWWIHPSTTDAWGGHTYIGINGSTQYAKAHLPYYEYAYMACEAVGSTIYMFGGDVGGTVGVVDTIYKFDTTTYEENLPPEELTVKLPEGMYGMASAAVGKKIYLFGGTNGTDYYDTINVFDTETETLTTLSATLPAFIANACAAAVGSKIYIIGGYDGTNYYNEISMFDTETQTLSEAPRILPMPNAFSTCEVIGTKIYTFCGANEYGSHGLICVYET